MAVAVAMPVTPIVLTTVTDIPSVIVVGAPPMPVLVLLPVPIPFVVVPIPSSIPVAVPIPEALPFAVAEPVALRPLPLSPSRATSRSTPFRSSPFLSSPSSRARQGRALSVQATVLEITPSLVFSQFVSFSLAKSHWFQSSPMLAATSFSHAAMATLIAEPPPSNCVCLRKAIFSGPFTVTGSALHSCALAGAIQAPVTKRATQAATNFRMRAGEIIEAFPYARTRAA